MSATPVPGSSTTGCIDDAAALPWRTWQPPPRPGADVYFADAERLAGEDWGLLPAAPLGLTARGAPTTEEPVVFLPPALGIRPCGETRIHLSPVPVSFYSPPTVPPLTEHCRSLPGTILTSRICSAPKPHQLSQS